MKAHKILAAIALCLASTLTFAATPTAPATNPGTATTHANGTHCEKGYVKEHGKCVKEKAKQ